MGVLWCGCWSGVGVFKGRKLKYLIYSAKCDGVFDKLGFLRDFWQRERESQNPDIEYI